MSDCRGDMQPALVTCSIQKPFSRATPTLKQKKSPNVSI